MERGNTVAGGGGMSTVTDDGGGGTTTVDPCPHCGMEGETDPVEGVACTICYEKPEDVDQPAATPAWSCDICGESEGVDKNNVCLSCDMEVLEGNVPPEMPSATITNPDGTTTTVKKNLDGTVTWTGAPTVGRDVPQGALPELDQFMDWRALSEHEDGTLVHTGYGPFGLRAVRLTRRDGSGTLTQRVTEEFSRKAGVPVGEHVQHFDSDGNWTDAEGQPIDPPGM